MIFDETTRRRLSRLRLVARRVRPGAFKGERRSTRHGSSLEFADYRDYVPGDDLRRLDWNVFARHDRPFIKLHHEEEDLALYVLVDASRSMDWGEGESHKLRYALRLAAALSAVGLSSGEQVALAVLGAASAASHYGPARGEHHLLPILMLLESQAPGEVLDLAQAIRSFARQPRRPGLAILISDLYLAEGLEPLLRPLQRARHEVVVLHLLSPDELRPSLSGDLRLLDCETGSAQEVHLTPWVRNLYRSRLRSWRAELQTESRRRGVGFVPLDTGDPWESAVLVELRRAGVLR